MKVNIKNRFQKKEKKRRKNGIKKPIRKKNII